MDRLPPMSNEAFIEAIRGKVEQVLAAVAAAVNDAPTGRVITASEEKAGRLAASRRSRSARPSPLG